QETILLIAQYLNRLTRQNDTLEPNQILQRFSARTIPSIDVHAYLQRILKYAPCSSECFLACLIYFERMSLCTRETMVKTHLKLSRPTTDTPLIINSFNIHRLLITGIMVAVKFMSDVFYTNSHVARVGGLPVEELNRLELEFLLFNDFDLLVTQQELDQ
ncbi:cyclin-domain-containing protein, partial [Gorgonomyces haynaldii]